jgi:hypothetical protein
VGESGFDRAAAVLGAMTYAELQALREQLRPFARWCLGRSASGTREVIVDEENLVEGDRRRWSDPDEVVDEALMRVYTGRRKTWDGKKPLVAWLKGVVRSVASEGVPRSKHGVRSPDLSSLLRRISPETSSLDFKLLLFDLVLAVRGLRQQRGQPAGRPRGRAHVKERVVRQLRSVDPALAGQVRERWRLGPHRSVFAPPSVDWRVVFNDQFVRVVEWVRSKTGKSHYSEVGELLDFIQARFEGKATVATDADSLKVRYHEHVRTISKEERQPESVRFWTQGRAGAPVS